MNQQKSNSNKRKRNDDHNSNKEIETENNIQIKKKKKIEIDQNTLKKLNDKEKYEIIIQQYEKEGYDSGILMKALYFYRVGGYKKFLSLYNENNLFKRKKNEKVNLLSYEKFCSDVLEEIKLIQLEKNIKKEREKNYIEKIHNLIDELFLKIQNNESIGEYFYLYRGKCYGRIGNVDKVLSILKEGIELTKNKLLLKKLCLNVGNCLYKIKDFVGAVECYNKSIELDPNFLNAYYNKGNSLMQIKDFIGSIECYNKSIELDPNDASAYYNKGNSLMQIKDFIGAIECYNKSIELDPNHVNSYFNKGGCFREMDKINDAISCINKAIAISPTNVKYYRCLAYIYRNNSNFEESIYCYTKAINLNVMNDPIDANFYRWRNGVYSQLKEKVLGFDNELFNSFDNFSFEEDEN